MNWTRFILGISLLAVSLVDAIPIDNGVEGDPEVQCGGTSIAVAFNTQNAFEGHVYVLNHYNEEKCRHEGDSSQNQGFIDLPFDSCGLKRERSLEPRGVFVTTTVVIKFHPTFITKIDRAVSIRCFYMEADKTVSQELEVSMLTTVLQTLTVPMPVCRYEILENDENGKPIRFAIIGQQVFHKWTCDTDTDNTFCMVVYGCVVSDGANDTIQLIDDQGCALDKHVLGNLEYATDLMAGKEAHVFKYADRTNLYFNCQIRITIKDPGTECERPQCPELRKKRSNSNRPKRQVALDDLIQDVSVQHPIMVGDLDMAEKDFARPAQQRDTPPPVAFRSHRSDKLSADFCVSPAGFMVMVFFSTLIFIVAVFLAVRIFMY
uniref:ZP domain-containing protein n=1 Tax=Plectus sambesii TaxID=2011161 RepID=A0A914WLF8_9BILA